MKNKKKILGGIGVIVATLALLASGFFLGFAYGNNIPQTLTVEGVSNIDGPADADFLPFWQAWQIIKADYLRDGEVSNEEKVRGAINGLISALDDPYSEFFSPNDSETFQENIQGNFGGIGAQIGIRDDNLVVVAPLQDTPAMRVGLKANDRIVLIDDIATAELNINEAVEKIRGPIGTKVTLSILRDDWEDTRDFEITREEITVPTLELEMFEGGVAHVSLFSFNANAERLFRDVMIEAIGTHNARGLVLDLRDNPGGFLEVAQDLAGWFVPRGTVIVSESNRDGEGAVLRANNNSALVDFPVVVLVNEGSASASEILAGALRDIRGTLLVGQKTFGKGTIQQLQDLRDGSSIKITVANWVLPSGHILEGQGLEPDFEVELTEDDIDSERDPQLDKAIEVLREEINK